MKRSTTKTIAYLALYVALYIVLKYVGNLIPFLQMPNGGSIELELIAVFICSYHLGWKIGIADAILSWLMTIVLGFPMYFVQPVQILLDYVLPLAVCGVASFLWPIKETSKPVTIVMGVVLAVASFFGIANSYSNTTVAYIAGAVVAAGMFGFTYWYLKKQKEIWNCDQYGFEIYLSAFIRRIFLVSRRKCSRKHRSMGVLCWIQFMV